MRAAKGASILLLQNFLVEESNFTPVKTPVIKVEALIVGHKLLQETFEHLRTDEPRQRPDRRIAHPFQVI